PKPYAWLQSEFKDVAAVNQTIETPDKATAMFVAGQRWHLRDDDPDYPALVLGNYILGGGFLNSRLAVRIRQKDGLSYGVASQVYAGPLDKDAQFLAYAFYAPQNVAKLETAFKEEIERVIKDGFTAEEVTAAKSGFLQTEQLNLSQDSSLARKLSFYRFLNRTMAWDEGFDKKIAALTPEQINAAMRKYVDLSKISIFKAGDFAKAASASK